jgi:branched-chain amino acid transport system substrate-binding protein
MFTRRAAALLPALAFTSPAAARVSDDVVRIGVLNDQSGIYADIGGQGSVVAARMAVEEFGGAVLGKPIDVIFGDHQNRPDVGSVIARRWIGLEKVDAIVDVPSSATALGVLNVTREKNRMLLLSGPGLSDFTGKQCSPTSVHWTYDTYAMANGTARALVQQGGDTWFFVTADNAGSHSQERDATEFVKRAGGRVLGSVRHPIATSDFSSFLLQARGSRAKVIGLANAGNDTVNAIKQAKEFGITQGGQKLAALLMFISDIHAIGLADAQGLVFTDAFYWDANDKDPRLVEAVHGAPRRPRPDLRAGRRLRRRAPLPESHQRRGNRRTGRGREADEGASCQRLLERELQDPAGRASRARHVPVRGEEAVRKQGPLGLLQGVGPRAGR